MKGTGSRGSSFDSFVGSSVHACTKFSSLIALGQMHLRRMNVQLRQLLKRARAFLHISLFPHYGMREAVNRILGRRTCLSAVRVPSRKQRLGCTCTCIFWNSDEAGKSRPIDSSFHRCCRSLR